MGLGVGSDSGRYRPGAGGHVARVAHLHGGLWPGVEHGDGPVPGRVGGILSLLKMSVPPTLPPTNMAPVRRYLEDCFPFEGTPSQG